MLKTLYTIFGVGVVTLYTAAAMLGWEIGGGSRRQLPPDARQNGYRSFHSGTTACTEENDADQFNRRIIDTDWKQSCRLWSPHSSSLFSA